jgi:hypothetical protein
METTSLLALSVLVLTTAAPAFAQDAPRFAHLVCAQRLRQAPRPYSITTSAQRTSLRTGRF